MQEIDIPNSLTVTSSIFFGKTYGNQMLTIGAMKLHLKFTLITLHVRKSVTVRRKALNIQTPQVIR